MKKYHLMKSCACVALSAAIAFPVLCGCQGKGGADEPQAGTQDAAAEYGGFRIEERTKSETISLMRAASYAESTVAETESDTYTLTAVTSDGYKNITYSSAWANASSAWASGKTVSDYVTLTPDTTDARSVTVTCLQAFGEAIVITATRGDNGLSSSVQCDYANKILNDARLYTVGSGRINCSSPGGVAEWKKHKIVLDGITPFSASYVFPSNSVCTINKGNVKISNCLFTTRKGGSLVTEIGKSEYYLRACELWAEISPQNPLSLISTYAAEQLSIGKMSNYVYGTCKFVSSNTTIYNYFTGDLSVSFSGLFQFGELGSAPYEECIANGSRPDWMKNIQYAILEAMASVYTSNTISFRIYIAYEHNGIESVSKYLGNINATTLGFDLSNLAELPATEEVQA